MRQRRVWPLAASSCQRPLHYILWTSEPCLPKSIPLNRVHIATCGRRALQSDELEFTSILRLHTRVSSCSTWPRANIAGWNCRGETVWIFIRSLDLTISTGDETRALSPWRSRTSWRGSKAPWRVDFQTTAARRRAVRLWRNPESIPINSSRRSASFGAALF